MNCNRRTIGRMLALLIAMVFAMSSHMTVFATQSDDNSLQSLGIKTEGVTVSPDFEYDHLNYDVVVPAGTTELELDPVLSNPNATINSVTGTTLENGSGTVTITTTAPSGAMTAYTLTVTTASDTNVDPAQAIAANQQAQSDTPQSDTAAAGVAVAQADAAAQAAQAETQQESETEDSRYVKVDKNTLQDAEDTISRLQKDLQVYKDRSHQFTYVIYALIAACVILLFLVVNLAVRRKDLAAEVKEYRRNRQLMGDFEDSADVIPEDGWLDDDPNEKPAGKKRKNRKSMEVPRYTGSDAYVQPAPSMTPDGRVNAQTSWTKQQVGTPMQPAREVTPYNGYARAQQAAPAKKHGSKTQVQGMQAQQSRVSDDTKLYRAAKISQSAQPNTMVPGDETIVLPGKKLTRAERAAAKKAAKAERKARELEQPAQYQQPQAQAPAQQQAPAEPQQAPAAQRPDMPKHPQGRQDIKVDMIDL